MTKICTSQANCAQERTLIFTKKKYPILECNQCSHRFLNLADVRAHVTTTYSDSYFFNGDAGYPNYLEQEKNLSRAGRRYAKILSSYTDPGTMLDVGCAAGFILNGFKESGWRCSGVEPNETMARFGRDNLNLDIEACDLETYRTDKKFDLVSLIQVIGHLYDLDKALQNISRLLKRNGLVLVESWNRKSVMARVMGKHWHEYSPPSVVHWFSDRTLTELFAHHGFEIIGKGYPAKKINISHALAFYREKLPGFTKPIFRLLDRSLGRLTFHYPPVDLKWYVFRKLRK